MFELFPCFSFPTINPLSTFNLDQTQTFQQKQYQHLQHKPKKLDTAIFLHLLGMFDTFLIFSIYAVFCLTLAHQQIYLATIGTTTTKA